MSIIIIKKIIKSLLGITNERNCTLWLKPYILSCLKQVYLTTGNINIMVNKI